MDTANKGSDRFMFTRNDTKMVKGLAIMLMIAHHLFLFPERYPFGFDFSSIIFIEDVPLHEIFGRFGRICVALFFFLGGYGLWCRRDKAKLLQNSIVHLFKVYWKVFFVFVPLGFLFFGSKVAYCELETVWEAYSEFDFKHVLANFVGWENTLCHEWWFFKAYLIMLVLGFVFMKCVKPRGFWIDCAFVVLLDMIIYGILPDVTSAAGLAGLNENFWYMTVFHEEETAGILFFLGIVFARYDGIRKIRELFGNLRPWVRKVLSAAGIFVIFYARYFILDYVLDFVYAPFLVVFFVELMDGVPVLPNVFAFLGKHSTNMWLTHGFFCYYFYAFAKITHISANPWIDLLIAVVLSLAASIGLDYFYKILGKYAGPLICRPELKNEGVSLDGKAL